MPVNSERDALDETYPDYTIASEAYADTLYQDVAQDEEIDGFLQESECYDPVQKRWTIPEAPSSREDLIDTLYSILSSIVGRFVKGTGSSVERELVNTLKVPGCDVKNEKGYRKWPVLVLRAAGPSFEIPVPLPPSSKKRTLKSLPGFSCMATFISVYLDSELGSPEEQLHEIATHVRAIFRDQPNRYFVRSLVLTQTHLRLVHFDRAGAEITPLIEFHQRPETLIRLMAGLSSATERVLGIDDSIQWTISKGRKEKGTLTTTGPTGERKTYPIIEQIPTARASIFGRATTCWRVQDPETLEELVVKDSWRPEDRPAEHGLLELVKGIPGVVQMVSYEVGRGETKEMRCPSTVGRYQNRILTRVTMKSYGRNVEFFTSTLQLLCAIRDAIAAHGRLLADDVRILHRDISTQNVLLGKSDASDGERGILIDLDLAFRATESQPTTEPNYAIGIPTFQSLNVLQSRHYADEALPHDYLDDLESFFYLFVYILLLYRPDGTRRPIKDEGPSILVPWTEHDGGSSSKSALYEPGTTAFRAERIVETTWGAACFELFEHFRDWMSDRMSDKHEVVFDDRSLTSLLSQREEHYSAVVAMFDEAIAKISAPKTTSTPALHSAPNSPLSPSVLSPRHSPALPTIDSVPSPLQPSLQPRRSARIRNLQLKKGQNVSPPVAAMPSTVNTRPDPSANGTTLRRSTRVAKRRRDDDPQPETRPANVKRRKKGPARITTGSR